MGFRQYKKGEIRMETRRVYVAESYKGLRLFRRSARGRTPVPPPDIEHMVEGSVARKCDETATAVRTTGGNIKQLALK